MVSPHCHVAEDDIRKIDIRKLEMMLAKSLIAMMVQFLPSFFTFERESAASVRSRRLSVSCTLLTAGQKPYFHANLQVADHVPA